MTYNRIEQSASDTVEGPDIGHQGHAKGEGNEDKIGCVGQRKASGRDRRSRGVGNLGAGKGKKKKQKGANKLSQAGHNVVACCQRMSEHGETGILTPRARLRGEGEDAVSSGSAHLVVSCPNMERMKILGVEGPGQVRSRDEQGKEK